MSQKNDPDDSKTLRDNAGTDPIKRPRRVARTLENFDIDRRAFDDLLAKSGGHEPSKQKPSRSAPSAGKPEDSQRIAKTLIDSDVQNKGAKEPKSGVTKTQLFNRVAKTQLFSRLAKTQLFADIKGVTAKRTEKRKPSVQFVAKTLLDRNLILQTRSQFSAREKQRLEQEISERHRNPPKVIEPIVAQKKVSACPFTWNNEDPKVRVKHCTACQSTIYNFDGMELQQAEALVFTRENRKNFVLYKRDDGKFMTSDCPVEKRRRQQLFGLVSVGLCVVACIGGFLMIMPAATPPDPTNQTEVTPLDAVTMKEQSSTPSQPGNHGASASGHLSGNQMGANTHTQSESSFSDHEQKGEFWQFSNEQPGDHFKPEPGTSSEE